MAFGPANGACPVAFVPYAGCECIGFDRQVVSRPRRFEVGDGSAAAPPLPRRGLAPPSFRSILMKYGSTSDHRQPGLSQGALGTLDWIEEWPLSEDAGAFADLAQGRCAGPKRVLGP